MYELRERLASWNMLPYTPVVARERAIVVREIMRREAK